MTGTGELYPDVDAAGGLWVLVNDALIAAGSSLRASRRYPMVASGTRWASVSPGAKERKFLLEIIENQGRQVHMAAGWTDELAEIAAAIRAVLEDADRPVSEIVPGIPFLELRPFAVSWERGTWIEDHWVDLLDHQVPYLEERAAAHLLQDLVFRMGDAARLIVAASKRPELRALEPFTSHFRLGFRAPPGLDFDPIIDPVMISDVYELHGPAGGALMSGTIAEALDAAVAYVTGVGLPAQESSETGRRTSTLARMLLAHGMEPATIAQRLELPLEDVETEARWVAEKLADEGRKSRRGGG
jgi:hypothetical protein